MQNPVITKNHKNRQRYCRSSLSTPVQQFCGPVDGNEVGVLKASHFVIVVSVTSSYEASA